VTDTKLVLPDTTTYESGVTTCPSGEVGKLVLVKWASADDPNAQPTVIDQDIGDARFTADRAAFTLAFVPEAKIAEIPKPESIPTLDNLSDVDPSSTSTVPGATPPTTAAGVTDTTAAGSTASTAAGTTDTSTANPTTSSGAATTAAPASSAPATTSG
jgi:hypothetical protein